jgi:hypothetical protein
LFRIYVISVTNLDHAALILSFRANIDVFDAMRYRDVMKEYGLGPNDEILTFERGEDATIGTKAILLHHVLRSHRIADISVGPK